MTVPEFGRLVDVPARQAWAHEALAFTPWLAENLDRLSDAIGIPLELTGREVGVGRYSADILARNPLDGTSVLIENQLEPSDHTHLGQILTYLAGLEAQVMVWLAPDFREEHLSALRWLNQHTDERFSFFAVKLRVVQIGSSPLAPLFDVLEKPNAWDRSLQKQAKAVAAEPSETTTRRRAFWELYGTLDPDIPLDSIAGGGVARWRSIIGTPVVVSRYLSKDNVGLFLRGGRGADGESISTLIDPLREPIEKRVGVSFGNRKWPFLQTLPLESDDPQAWKSAIDWLVSETKKYETAVGDAFGAIGIDTGDHHAD